MLFYTESTCYACMRYLSMRSSDFQLVVSGWQSCVLLMSSPITCVHRVLANYGKGGLMLIPIYGIQSKR